MESTRVSKPSPEEVKSPQEGEKGAKLRTTKVSKASTNQVSNTLRIKIIIMLLLIFCIAILWEDTLLNKDGRAVKRKSNSITASNVTTDYSLAKDGVIIDNGVNYKDVIESSNKAQIEGYATGSDNNTLSDKKVDKIILNITNNSHDITKNEQDTKSTTNKDYSSIKKAQIENYKTGSALIFNVHITHHGGTTMGYEMSKWGPTPTSSNETSNSTSTIKKAISAFPWTYNETSTYTNSLRQHYHYISQEFRFHPTRKANGAQPKRPLSSINWEYGHLLSIYVARHPLDRLLSGDGELSYYFGEEKDRNKTTWHEFSKSWQADNYALDVLTDTKCIKGKKTTLDCLQSAKKLLERFTFILDQDCLTQGIQKMAELLDKPIPKSIHNDGGFASKRASAKERIPFDDIYDYLVEKNKRSIELYEWSKTISLVRCEQI